MAPCPGLPRWAGTRKVKTIWILLKQETVSGSGISCAICKSAPRSRQITMPVPHRSVFRDRMPFLPPNQQCQSTEGITMTIMTKLVTSSRAWCRLVCCSCSRSRWCSSSKPTIGTGIIRAGSGLSSLACSQILASIPGHPTYSKYHHKLGQL